MSLDYETIKPEITSIVSDIMRNQSDVAQNLDDVLQVMQVYCQNNTEFVYSFQDYVFTFPCETINNGSEAVITYAISDLVEQNYYKKYDCKFWQCDMNPPYHLISEKAHNYWRGLFYWSLIISLILIALTFLLIENKHDLPILAGIVLIISSLPFLKINWLLGLLKSWPFFEIFQAFFTKAYVVFLIAFIAGIVLIGIGIVLKFLGLGRFLGKWFGQKESKKNESEDEEEEKPKSKKSKKNK